MLVAVFILQHSFAHLALHFEGVDLSRLEALLLQLASFDFNLALLRRDDHVVGCLVEAGVWIVHLGVLDGGVQDDFLRQILRQRGVLALGHDGGLVGVAGHDRRFLLLTPSDVLLRTAGY